MILKHGSPDNLNPFSRGAREINYFKPARPGSLSLESSETVLRVSPCHGTVPFNVLKVESPCFLPSLTPPSNNIAQEELVTATNSLTCSGLNTSQARKLLRKTKNIFDASSPYIFKHLSYVMQGTVRYFRQVHHHENNHALPVDNVALLCSRQHRSTPVNKIFI